MYLKKTPQQSNKSAILQQEKPELSMVYNVKLDYQNGSRIGLLYTSQNLKPQPLYFFL